MWKPEENIAQYVPALREVAEKCGYEASLSDMLHDRLVCGMNHEATQCRLLTGNNLTYDTAVDIATTRQKRCRTSDLEVLGLASLNKIWFCSWTQLHNKNVPKVLGVTFDGLLTFSHHVKGTQAKVGQCNNIL